MNALNLQGQRFGHLTVVDAGPRDKQDKRRWLCHCDCGSWRLLPTDRLTTGNTKSCGCLRKAACAALGSQSTFRTAPGEAGFRALVTKYRWGATSRGLAFDLSDADVRVLTQQPCHYCAEPPTKIKYGSGRKTASVERTGYAHNGIDRKDPQRGYSLENCIPCCTTCNYAKQDLTYEAFLSLVSRIHTHRLKENT